MKKKYIKKILATSIISLLFVQVLYVFVVEPTVVKAVGDDVIVTLNVTSGITISDGSAVTMSPDLGVSSNSSVGGSSWVVRTNNLTGYNLGVKASASPALVSGANSFADYTEAVNGTPEVWSTSSTTKEFGFSAYGNDVVTGTWGTGATCGTTTPPATMKYVGFEITDKNIANSNTVTTTTGTTTNICFAAEQNTVYAPSGTYTATITATATTN